MALLSNRQEHHRLRIGLVLKLNMVKMHFFHFDTILVL